MLWSPRVTKPHQATNSHRYPATEIATNCPRTIVKA